MANKTTDDTVALLQREAEIEKAKADLVKALIQERTEAETRIKAIGTELQALGYRPKRTRKAKAAAEC